MLVRGSLEIHGMLASLFIQTINTQAICLLLFANQMIFGEIRDGQMEQLFDRHKFQFVSIARQRSVRQASKREKSTVFSP